MSSNPKFKLDQWVFSLSRTDLFKIWGVRYKKGDGVQSSDGWVYYDRDHEYREGDLVASLEEFKEHCKNSLDKKLKGIERIYKASLGDL